MGKEGSRQLGCGLQNPSWKDGDRGPRWEGMRPAGKPRSFPAPVSLCYSVAKPKGDQVRKRIET